MPATSQQTDGLTIGFGALAVRTPYNDITKARLFPSLRYQAQNLTVGVVEVLQYKAFSHDILNIYLAIKPGIAPCTDEHDGQEFELAIRQFIPGLGMPVFSPACVKHLSKELSSFLYGVSI